MKSITQIITKSLDSFAFLLSRRRWSQINLAHQNLVLTNPSIWQFCTPKSASTFLTKILIELWREECTYGVPVPYYGQRVQEPDWLSISKYLLFCHKNKRYFSGHLHTKNTDFLRSHILGERAKVIVQTRDLKDTCVSFKDHMDKLDGTVQPMIVSVSSYWPQLNDQEKYKLIAQAYVPWHLDFLKSWELYPARMDIEFTSIVTETLSVIAEICNYVGIKKSKEEMQLALDKVNRKKSEETRKNVGVAGRGKKSLPKEAINYIDEMEDFWNQTFQKSKLDSAKPI